VSSIAESEPFPGAGGGPWALAVIIALLIVPALIGVRDPTDLSLHDPVPLSPVDVDDRRRPSENV